MNRRDFLARTGIAGLATLMANDARAANRPRVDAMPDYRATGARILTDSTPAADGFRVPAEWEAHESCIMVMPPPQNWKDFGIPLDDVRGQWADVANRLSKFEPVLMVIDPREVRRVGRLLNSEIETVDLPVNDGWSRDSGPVLRCERCR